MTERTKKLLPFVLAALAAVGGLFAAAEEPKQTKNKTFSERLKESSAAHFWIASRKYDEALKALPYVDNIDAIEPVTGLTALGMAAQNETADAYDLVVPLVSLYRADVDAADKHGLMPLHYAAQAGNLSVVEFLVNQGANVDSMPDIKGCGENCPSITPLYLAYQKGRNRIVEFLITRGAEPIDSKTQADLELQAKIQEALNAFYDSSSRQPPEGVNRQEWKRQRYDGFYDEAVSVLRDAGRNAEADQVNALRGPLFDALENTPRPRGMDPATWYKQVMQTAAVNASRTANNQQERD